VLLRIPGQRSPVRQSASGIEEQIRSCRGLSRELRCRAANPAVILDPDPDDLHTWRSSHRQAPPAGWENRVSFAGWSVATRNAPISAISSFTASRIRTDSRKPLSPTSIASRPRRPSPTPVGEARSSARGKTPRRCVRGGICPKAEPSVRRSSPTRRGATRLTARVHCVPRFGVAQVCDPALSGSSFPSRHSWWYSSWRRSLITPSSSSRPFGARSRIA
jgi:hypothetical protein